MSSHDLRAFIAFAELLSFTHAARRVHVSQPALFAVVKRLADALGASLYVRRGRALALTPAGAALLAHAREVVEAEAALAAAVHGDDAGVAILACGEGALAHVVAPRVAAFARAHPGRLRIHIADGPAALLQVKSGQAHVAVLAHDSALDDDTGARDALQAKALVKSRLVACGLPSLLPRGEHSGAGLDLAALAALPLLVPPVGRPLRAALDAACAACGLRPRVVVEVGGWEALLALARLGVGVALLNDVVTADAPLHTRAVVGLPAVLYQTVARRRRGALATSLLRALHERAA